jgi:hypothetical protein
MKHNWQVDEVLPKAAQMECDFLSKFLLLVLMIKKVFWLQSGKLTKINVFPDLLQTGLRLFNK